MSRPSFFTDIPEKPQIFKYEFTDENGIDTTWKYDLSINPNGPYEILIVYPKGYDHRTIDEKLAEQNKKLSQSKQKFWNNETGKTVSYQRAKSLGII